MSLAPQLHPTFATIDLHALAHNLAVVRSRIPTSCEIIAVVKANAYGHGLVEVASALLRLGVARLGVASLDEGLALRQAGIEAAILVMGAAFPHQLPDMIAHRLTPVLYDAGLADAFAKQLVSRHEPYPVHLKVDTGMGRLGFSPEEVLPLLQRPAFKGPLRAEGLMTHLADADSEERDYTEGQLARFRVLLDRIKQSGLAVPLIHTANSAAILRYPSSHFTAVRPGIMLYGYHTLPAGDPAPDLKPVLSLTTTIAQIRSIPKGGSVSYNRTFIAQRPSRVAILPIGYADGYNRLLSNRASVLIGGRRAPVVGRICMDMTLVDVTDLADVSPGQQAVLIGRQGGQCITADDIAAWLDTISYEVLCAIGPRVPRTYLSETPHSA
ncbi:MAG: alanine racemase [Nitrospiraceae bacterium]|nr:MAG: alanine racemase [Nitrospiraceae bacterium]